MAAESKSIIDFLHHIRELELETAIAEMPSPSEQDSTITILELGAGTGWQAKELTERGYQVIALDLPDSAYKEQRVFPITEYDGVTLPAEDASIHVVFSSNVLEHVAEIDGFLDEIHRVLIPGGLAIHTLPTSSCRFWSLFAHYGWLAKRIIEALRSERGRATKTGEEEVTPKPSKNRMADLFPSRHGERGYAVSEIYYYSEYWWVRKFLSHEFIIEKIATNDIFYTMANFLQFQLAIESRQWLSKYLGSACKIYKTRKSSVPK